MLDLRGIGEKGGEGFEDSRDDFRKSRRAASLRERDHLTRGSMNLDAAGREIDRRWGRTSGAGGAGGQVGARAAFLSMVESVRRTLKRLSADADRPGRSGRPGLLPDPGVCSLVREAHTHTRACNRAHGSPDECVRCSRVSKYVGNATLWPLRVSSLRSFFFYEKQRNEPEVLRWPVSQGTRDRDVDRLGS